MSEIKSRDEYLQTRNEILFSIPGNVVVLLFLDLLFIGKFKVKSLRDIIQRTYFYRLW